MAETVAQVGGSSRGSRRERLVALVLVLATLGSAFGVIYTAHRSRELFRKLEQARRDENEIQVEWRQLLVERSTVSSHARVESMAGAELQMQPPPQDVKVLVLP